MNSKTKLLVVYKKKDEEYFDFLKGLVDDIDDFDDEIVGTEDETVRVLPCDEDKWLKWQKLGKADDLADKFLFIDDIKGVDLEKPKYNRYGIAYGYIDNNHFSIIVDEKYKWTEGYYRIFLNELNELLEGGIAEENAFKDYQLKKKDTKKKAIIGGVACLVWPLAGAVLAAGLNVPNIVEALNNKKVIRQQMLSFGITKAYFDEFGKFINK